MQYVLKDELRAFGVTVKHLVNGGWTLFEMYAAGHLIPVTVEYDGTPKRSRKGGGKRMAYRGSVLLTNHETIDVFDLEPASADDTYSYTIECRPFFGAAQSMHHAPADNTMSYRGVEEIPGSANMHRQDRAYWERHFANLNVSGSFAFPTIDDEPVEECPLCTGSGHREDSIVSDITTQLIERAVAGKKKYGVTLDRTDFTPQQWAQHALEELLDGAGYLASLIRDLDKHRPLKPVPSHAELLAMAPGEYSDWEKRIWARGFKACVTALIRK